MYLHKPPGTLPRKRVSALTFRDFVHGLELLTGSIFNTYHGAAILCCTTTVCNLCIPCVVVPVMIDKIGFMIRVLQLKINVFDDLCFLQI